MYRESVTVEEICKEQTKIYEDKEDEKVEEDNEWNPNKEKVTEKKVNNKKE